MKKYLFMAWSVILGTAALAQDIHASDVPSVVRNTFHQKFPRATDVEWERKQDQYKVEFEIARADHEAWLNAAGQIVRHQFDIGKADLPKPVKDVLDKDYSDYKVDDLEQIERQGKVYFKIEVKRKGDERDIFLDTNGKIVSPN